VKLTTHKIDYMKKSLILCAVVAMLCQSSFAMGSPLFASVNTDRSVPDAGSTMGMLAVGLTGLAILARKIKK